MSNNAKYAVDFCCGKDSPNTRVQTTLLTAGIKRPSSNRRPRDHGNVVAASLRKSKTETRLILGGAAHSPFTVSRPFARLARPQWPRFFCSDDQRTIIIDPSNSVARRTSVGVSMNYTYLRRKCYISFRVGIFCPPPPPTVCPRRRRRLSRSRL